MSGHGPETPTRGTGAPRVATAGDAIGAPTEAASGTPPAIDLERLADKVYQLMLADVRLARARGDR